MANVKNVSINEISYDPSLQIRVGIDEETVESYAELLRESEDWPFATPVTLFDIGGTLVLADGWHRVEAAKRSNWTCVVANVRTGSFAEAFRFALSTNGDHGLPRSNADKRKAVESALVNEDYYNLSNRELAKVCAVSEGLVRLVKQERRSQFEHLRSEIDRCLCSGLSAMRGMGEIAWRTGAFEECRSMFFDAPDIHTGQNLNRQWELVLEMSNPKLPSTERITAGETLIGIWWESVLASIA